MQLYTVAYLRISQGSNNSLVQKSASPMLYVYQEGCYYLLWNINTHSPQAHCTVQNFDRKIYICMYTNIHMHAHTHSLDDYRKQVWSFYKA